MVDRCLKVPIHAFTVDEESRPHPIQNSTYKRFLRGIIIRSRRTLSPSSQRILSMYLHWLQHLSPSVSMCPKPVWQGEAAADAMARDDFCQIGGYLKFGNGDIKWFSQKWFYDDFAKLEIPVRREMQKEISSFETLVHKSVFCMFSHS